MTHFIDRKTYSKKDIYKCDIKYSSLSNCVVSSSLATSVVVKIQAGFRTERLLILFSS